MKFTFEQIMKKGPRTFFFSVFPFFSSFLLTFILIHLIFHTPFPAESTRVFAQFHHTDKYNAVTIGVIKMTKITEIMKIIVYLLSFPLSRRVGTCLSVRLIFLFPVWLELMVTDLHLQFFKFEVNTAP